MGELRLDERFRALDALAPRGGWPELESVEPKSRPSPHRGRGGRWQRPVAAVTTLALAGAAIGYAAWTFRRAPSPLGDGRRNGLLAFVAEGFRRSEVPSHLYLVNPDGTGLDLVHPSNIRALGPDFSPDGSQLSFGGALEGPGASGSGLWILDVATGEIRSKVATDAAHPDWSPHGDRIAYSATPPGLRASIHVFDVADREVFRITAGPSDAWPSWSPDGERIVFARYAPAVTIGIGCGVSSAGAVEFGLFLVGSDGDGPVRLTDGGCDALPAWSPDGERIAFVRGHSELATISPDGGEVRSVLEFPQEEGRCHPELDGSALIEDLAWSPDGTRLAMVADGCLYTIAGDGTDLRLVVGPGSGLYVLAADWGAAPTTGSPRPIPSPTATEDPPGTTTASGENGTGTARCSAEVPAVVEPGRPVGVRAWIENLSDEPINHNVGGSVANVVVYDTDGNLLWDSLSSLGPDRPIIAIGDTPLAPGERKELGVIDTVVRWPGPLRVVVGCSLQENGNFELASVDVEVAVPGPTPDRGSALERAFEATHGLFDECGTDGNPRIGQIPPPDGATDVPPLQVRCTADVELQDGFAVVTIHFESPDAPSDFRIGRYLHDTVLPGGVDPLVAGRWAFVVTEEEVFEVDLPQTVFWSPTGAAYAIYSFDQDEGWYRGASACDTEPGEYRAGIVFPIRC